MLYRDRDWDEVLGVTSALCYLIRIKKALVVGDEIAFRIEGKGGIYFSAAPTINFPVEMFEAITLDPGMIAAGETTLISPPISENSPLVWPKGGGPQVLNSDYSVDLLNKKIKWNVAGKDGMAASLISGNVLVVKYLA
jgi:hypothetical protein